MNNPAFIVQILIFLLPQFAAAAGGNRTEQVFYCDAPGCAAQVTVVFCQDENVFSGDHIPQCAGPPPPNFVCQYHGQAFVSTTSRALCEFEGNGDYIETKKCKDLNSSCVFPTDTTPPTPVDSASKVSGGIGLVILTHGCIYYLFL